MLLHDLNTIAGTVHAARHSGPHHPGSAWVHLCRVHVSLKRLQAPRPMHRLSAPRRQPVFSTSLNLLRKVLRQVSATLAGPTRGTCRNPVRQCESGLQRLTDAAKAYTQLTIDAVLQKLRPRWHSPCPSGLDRLHVPVTA
jgi:hypothetical protein